MDAREFHATPDTDKRAIGRLLRFALIASVGFAVVLLVLLAGASANTSIFERHYPALLVTTAVMALALLVLVAELIRRLIQRYRRGLFGTRLMARLALIRAPAPGAPARARSSLRAWPSCWSDAVRRS